MPHFGIPRITAKIIIYYIFFTGSLVVDLFSAIILDIVNGYVITRGINMSQINP